MKSNCRNMQKSNSGITLIEILVVIAILAVTVGIAGVSISLMYSRDAEKCAKNINNALESARMRSMSKEGSSSFWIDISEAVWSFGIEPSVEKKELPGRIDVAFASEGSYDLSSCKKLTIEFDKATGKVTALKAEDIPVDVRDIGVIKIRVTNSDGKTATVLLVTATGKHYVEYGS